MARTDCADDARALAEKLMDEAEKMAAALTTSGPQRERATAYLYAQLYRIAQGERAAEREAACDKAASYADTFKGTDWSWDLVRANIIGAANYARGSRSPEMVDLPEEAEAILRGNLPALYEGSDAQASPSVQEPPPGSCCDAPDLERTGLWVLCAACGTEGPRDAFPPRKTPPREAPTGYTNCVRCGKPYSASVGGSEEIMWNRLRWVHVDCDVPAPSAQEPATPDGWVEKAAEDICIELDKYVRWRDVAYIIRKYMPPSAEREPSKAATEKATRLFRDPCTHPDGQAWKDPARACLECVALALDDFAAQAVKEKE